MKPSQLLGVITLNAVLLACPCAQAADWSASGFGTVGYATSDRPYKYQRFVDESGTIKRDTVLGGQLDLKISPEWSATLQAKVAPSATDDKDWALTASWAFASWRPNNDWLLRLGKQRLPMYLNSENLDVGQTYDFARLPFEMYGLSPTNDVVGLYVSRNWIGDMGEISLDVLAGATNLDAHVHTRDQGNTVLPMHTKVAGGVLSLKLDTSTWRLGLYHTTTSRRDGQGFPTHFTYVDSGGGLGYYKVSDLIADGAGPVATTSSIANDVITLGGDMELAPGWRLVSELVRNIQRRTDLGANNAGGYVALLHKVGAFTPYVSYAKLRAMGASVRMADNLNAAQLPGGPLTLNAAQRAASDAIMAYDQDTLALGTSYVVTTQSKIKAEWARTRIGNRSASVESPPGDDVIRRQRINVMSLNYNFVF